MRSVVGQARGRLKVPVQHKGIKVCPVGPNDGAEVVIDPYLAEEIGVRERLEDRPTQLSGQIDVARTAVAEPQSEPVMTKHLS